MDNKDKKELQKELKQKQRDIKKLEKDIFKMNMSEKTSCISSLIFSNEKLRKIISPLSAFEARIIFAELINSDAFFTLVKDTAHNKETLVQKAREVQTAKTERRKQNSAVQDENSALQEVVLEEPYVFDEHMETFSETVQSGTEFENQTEF